MAAGAVLVAALALLTDLVFALIQRIIVSRGVTGKFRPARHGTAATVPTTERIPQPA